MLDRTLEVLGIKIESKWRMIGGDVNVNIIFNYNGREHSLYQSESIENSKVVKENGEHLVDVCAERGSFLSNTFFQHKMIHRYSWRRREDGGEELSIFSVSLLRCSLS